MANVLSFLRKHLPVEIGIVLIVVNALIAQGLLNIPSPTIDLVNAVLAALGLGILHKRMI